MPLTALHTPNHDILHLLLQQSPLLGANPIRKLLLLPHRLLRIVLLRVLLYTVIRQMRKTIVDVIQRILIVGEAEIALLVEPYFRRGEILDEDPLSDIELPPLNKQWILDVLLYDELGGLAKGIVSDIVEVIEASYSSSPRHNYLSKSLQLGLAIQTFLIPLIACCGSPLVNICSLLFTKPSIASYTFASYPSYSGFSITGISACWR